MSDVIKLLPDSVANQIAAGEVIQRPASVVKELVENAVDAGATSIKIILRDGGKNLIQVIDNGCGMSDTDARLAFERHATSKITAAADLFDLHTMGFRGEALPSIVAVSLVELTTMRHSDTIGTRVIMAASKVEKQTPEACAPGTNIAVKNLFFNFPARRKFLKNDSVELKHIVHEFERLALVNPDKEFLLVHNDVTLHQLLPGSLKQRVVALFGKGLEKQLIPVSTETSLVKISGLVSLPEYTRKRNALQYFFVNGRNMRHPYFQKAVQQCYENLIPADHQPNFFLDFEVDPATIDVNIHPTKSEIKFENEVPIWQILMAAVKEALGKFSAAPSIDFDTSDSFEIPVFNPVDSLDIDSIPDSNYNPFDPQNSQYLPADSGSDSAISGDSAMPHRAPSAMNSDFAQRNSRPMADWDKLYSDFRNATSMESTPTPDDFTTGSAPRFQQSAMNFMGADGIDSPAITQLPDFESKDTSDLLLYRNRFLLAPAARGVMVIDRYRAHLKVLYEQFMKHSDSMLRQSQQLLFPETVQLSVSQNVVLGSMKNDVVELGFEIEFAGDNVWAINAVPTALKNINAAEALVKMIDCVADETMMPGADLHRRVALSMARAAAVMPGVAMTYSEAEALLGQFLSLPDPAYSPDGKPTFFILELSEIARRLSLKL